MPPVERLDHDITSLANGTDSSGHDETLHDSGGQSSASKERKTRLIFRHSRRRASKGWRIIGGERRDET